MRTVLSLLLVVIVAVTLAVYGRAQTRTSKSLDIYVVDVEGGNATLFISPNGESVLIDTGNAGGTTGRDAGRILDAAKDAGLQQIDHLITTHWHGDHFGGMAEVAAKIPIREFIDHGPSVETNAKTDNFLKTTYPQLYANAKHTVVKPGDRVAMSGVEWRIVQSAGQHITNSLPGAGKPNPYCAAFQQQNPDATENAQSVGSHITFGKFRALHLGDLTVNKEFDLMCPTNRVGTVDLWIVSHHGQAVSNAQVLAHAIEPRAAIMNNGTRKGGQPEAMKVLFSIPGLEDLWQMHFSQLSGQEYTVPGTFIANNVDAPEPAMAVAPFVAPPRGAGSATPAPAHNGPAHWIKVSAQQDGTFTVTNTRNDFSKTYKAKL
jgi:competence protein ComEC